MPRCDLTWLRPLITVDWMNVNLHRHINGQRHTVCWLESVQTAFGGGCKYWCECQNSAVMFSAKHWKLHVHGIKIACQGKYRNTPFLWSESISECRWFLDLPQTIMPRWRFDFLPDCCIPISLVCLTWGLCVYESIVFPQGRLMWGDLFWSCTGRKSEWEKGTATPDQTGRA